MGVFALKRFACGEDCDPKHYLSLVSNHHNADGDWPVTANSDLPFEMDDIVFGSSCRGLVYFMGKNGKVIVCNLTTRKWIVFPMPDYLPAASLVRLGACGLGYDPISRDYKLLRSYILHYSEEERLGEDFVIPRYLRSEEYTELYSFKSRSWNEMGTPEASIICPCAVYVRGSCYWTAVLGFNFGGLKDDPFRDQILSFDIATEKFGHFSFPPTSISVTDLDTDARFKVVEYGGELAALIYGGPGSDARTCTSSLYIDLFVWQKKTWEKMLDLRFDHVERPLGLGEMRDGSVLFLEGQKDCTETSSPTSELMVYNFHSKELKRLGIHDHRSHMIPVCFDFKEYRIPGSTPMAFVDNIVPSSEDVEEMKMMSKNRPRMKMKSGRKKNKKMVFALMPKLLRPRIKMKSRRKRKNKKTVFALLPKHPATESDRH